MKTSNRKKIIIRAILIFILLNIIACPIITKIIYDKMFPRYDETVVVAEEYKTLVDNRKTYDFEVGKNTLKGYLYDNDDKTALIVIAPGFNSSCDDYLPQIKKFSDAGYGVFTFDTTGSCTSEGKSSVGFEQELVDLDEALNFVESQGNFGYGKIALFGHSRGGYSVCSVTLFGHKADAIVSVGGINSAMEGIMEPAVDMMGNFAYANYPMLYLYQLVLFDKDYVDADAVDAFNKTTIPTLIVHGAEDEKIAVDEYSVYSHMDEIEKNDVNDEVDYILNKTPGKDGHVDILTDDALMDDIVSFIDESVR
ncbi:MAG: lysophospholipase [Clostridia bacterium]|nr:lysophospholipase [Clostridia bacterium]